MPWAPALFACSSRTFATTGWSPHSSVNNRLIHSQLFCAVFSNPHGNFQWWILLSGDSDVLREAEKSFTKFKSIGNLTIVDRMAPTILAQPFDIYAPLMRCLILILFVISRTDSRGKNKKCLRQKNCWNGKLLRIQLKYVITAHMRVQGSTVVVSVLRREQMLMKVKKIERRHET